ncbi:MAG: hypothetical protein R2854_02895 [Caldilineaceae bacterium]
MTTSARLLDEGWQLKKQLASRITNPALDDLYATARQAGALGGKIAGAGGRRLSHALLPRPSGRRARLSMR